MKELGIQILDIDTHWIISPNAGHYRYLGTDGPDVSITVIPCFLNSPHLFCCVYINTQCQNLQNIFLSTYFSLSWTSQPECRGEENEARSNCNENGTTTFSLTFTQQLSFRCAPKRAENTHSHKMFLTDSNGSVYYVIIEKSGSTQIFITWWWDDQTVLCRYSRILFEH